jgi:sugar lactone lactonase YvrE
LSRIAPGVIFAADWTGNGGVSIVSPDGRIARLLAQGRPTPLRPNGIALEPGGSFLVAHLGLADGGLFRLHADGHVETIIDNIDGAPIPPCNFPLRDSRGRIWLTVSTRVAPRADDYRPSAASGFIALVENGEARIVADGLGYANECALTPNERHLLVNETFARRLTRFDVAPDGVLSNRATVATFGAGTFPDGVVLDEEGCAWVTSIVSNRVIRVSPDGSQRLILEDAAADHLAWVEEAFQASAMGRPHLDGVKSRMLRNVSSLAFGGPDLATAFLGCLLDERIPVFDVPVKGARPGHFDFDLGPLTALAACGAPLQTDSRIS